VDIFCTSRQEPANPTVSGDEKFKPREGYAGNSPWFVLAIPKPPICRELTDNFACRTTKGLEEKSSLTHCPGLLVESLSSKLRFGPGDVWSAGDPRTEHAKYEARDAEARALLFFPSSSRKSQVVECPIRAHWTERKSVGHNWVAVPLGSNLLHPRNERQ
jgi:hypothetical protein